MKRLFLLSPLLIFVLAFLLLASQSAQSAQSAETTEDADRLSAAQISAIDGLIKNHLAEAQVPGAAVAVVRRGKLLLVGTRGVASLEHGDEVTRSSVFELASLTKQMTALAVLDLVEQERLSLNDRVVDFVDEAPSEWSEITIGHLLSHMGGLAHRFEEKPHGSFLLDYTTERMLESAKTTPMQSRPGTDWEYSDLGYFLAGYVVERVTGEAFGEVLERRYFEPLGMTHTQMLDQASIIPGRVDGYTIEEGELRNDRRVWQFGLTSHFGVMSTIDDMVRWEKALWESANPKAERPPVLPSAAVATTTEIVRQFSVPGPCDPFGYARGWYVRVVDGVRYADHGGFTGNFYLRSPDTGLAVIVLTNREYGAGPPPSDLAWAIAEIVDPSVARVAKAC